MCETALARVDRDSYMAVRSRHNSTGQETIENLIFKRIPTIAGSLLSSIINKDSSSTLFFFNEHYVVKPAQSCVEFRWHRDDEEQLGMCIHRDTIQPYISAWCALDDVTKDNGPLRFVSRTHGSVVSDTLESLASRPVLVQAGSIVLFLSNVWHCSSNNESPSIRRAWYVQYSLEMITARPHASNDKRKEPLSFAIPCEKEKK